MKNFQEFFYVFNWVLVVAIIDIATVIISHNIWLCYGLKGLLVGVVLIVFVTFEIMGFATDLLER